MLLVPLLHVLGFHSKILSSGGDSSVGGVGSGLHLVRQTWASITQRPVTGSEGAVTPREREVPLLLRDPVTLLLQLVLLLPSRIDQGNNIVLLFSISIIKLHVQYAEYLVLLYSSKRYST